MISGYWITSHNWDAVTLRHEVEVSKSTISIFNSFCHEAVMSFDVKGGASIVL